VLDLLAATLRAGQPLASALVAVAPLGGEYVEVELRRIGGLLRYGAEPAVAWGSLTISSLAPVARIACRSAESGIRLAHGFELLAAELRDEARAAAVARAHRAGVWAMAPLGLCFLPAFACLGVLPVVAGIAHGMFAGTGR
jgi:pilus assembly protein TadC